MTPQSRLIAASLVVVLGLLANAAVVLAVDPSPGPGGAGDVRTNPAAPGLVGDPIIAVLGVAVVALLTVALTLAIARLGDRR